MQVQDPEDRIIRIHPVNDNHFGYCECCADWITQNDDEVSACPNRYLSDHGMDWRNKVRAAIKDNRPREVEDLQAIHAQLKEG